MSGISRGARFWGWTAAFLHVIALESIRLPHASVSVIVPNWNGESRLRTLLKSLQQQEGGHIAEILVVDNGSTDHSRETAVQAGARVIALPSNQGFAAGVNQGIVAACYPWLAIVNNDVEPRPDWLSRLLQAALDHSAWFATGKLLNSADPQRIDGSFDALSLGATACRCGSGRLDGLPFNHETTIHFAPFTAVLARRELFARAGALDQDFESYLEDVDFGLRCALQGFSGVYVPTAVAYHVGSATLGRWHPDTVRRIARNQLLLIAKHYPPRWFLRYGWHVFVAQGLWGLLALRHGAGFAWLRGKSEGCRALFRSARIPQPGLAPILQASERQILDLQRVTGFDWYWRLYFALT